jgi:hypothetical protein
MFLRGVRQGSFIADVVNPFLERAGVPVVVGKGYSDELLRTPQMSDYNKPTKAPVINSAALF